LDTRVGSIDLAIPKLREGSYYPSWLLEPRRRAERAVVAECYVQGVSTRRVEKLVQALGIERLSKSQVSRMAKELDAEVAAFRNRPELEGDGVSPSERGRAEPVRPRHSGHGVDERVSADRRCCRRPRRPSRHSLRIWLRRLCEVPSLLGSGAERTGALKEAAECDSAVSHAPTRFVLRAVYLRKVCTCSLACIARGSSPQPW
jgi:hypothetical protein